MPQLGLEWCEKSEETHDPQIELLETTSAQEPPNPSEPLRPRDCMVPVVFPGPVSQEGCCRFTCELLKHIMYQRQQLPLPYEQLKHFYRKPSPQVGFGRKLVGRLWLLDGRELKRESKESSGPVSLSSCKRCFSVPFACSGIDSLTLPAFPLVLFF